jgi:hypothetical protein
MSGVAVLEKRETVAGGIQEVTGIREEMLDLSVQFEDATLKERVGVAIRSVLSCKATCVVNPINQIHKLRDAFWRLSQDGEITSDQAVSMVARMINAAGETYSTRQSVVDKIKANDYSVLGL